MANEPTQIGIDEDAGAAARILQEQYYLIYQLPNFISKPIAPASSPLAATGWNAFSYPSEKEDGNSVLQNAFFKTKSMKVLNKMSPALLSSLVPEIRLFKIFYSADGKQVDFNWEIPFTDFINTEDVNTILSGRRGTLGGVNISDFSYNFIGTNKAEAETALTAKVTLKFASIDSLLQTIYVDENGDILPDETESKFSFRYSDLVNQESRFNKDDPTQFNAKYYRIKAVVGLRADQETIKNISDSGEFIGTDGSVQSFGNKANAELITKAVNSTRTVLHLYPVNHTLNFEEDGTISLQIEYRAAIESIFNDEEAGDLFLSTDNGKAIFRSIQELKKKKIEQQEELKELQEGPTADEDAYKSKKEQFEEENKATEEQIQGERASFLTDFLGEMFYVPGNPQKTITLKKMKYDSTLVNDKGVTRSLLKDLGATDDNEQETNRQVVAAIRNGALFKSSQNKILIEYLDSVQHEAKKSRLISVLKGKPPNEIDPKQLQELDMEDEEQITFFYLGDILQYFLSRCIENYQESRVPPQDIPKFIVGNIPLIVPLQIGETIKSDGSITSYGQIGQQFSSIPGEKFTTLTVNLSRIPISYNYFLKWYVDTVLKTKKERYPIHVFMNDLTNLIQRATLNVYGFKESSLLNTRTVNMSVTVNGDLYNKINGGEQSFRPLFGIGSFEDGNIDSVTVAQTRNLHVLYTNAIPLTNININNPLDNEDRGIYTFTIGKNIGLLKSLKFNKTDIPFAKEARMTQEGSLTRGVLRMKYNASLNLFGTCVFRPGDVFVINPVFLSTGKFLKPAEQAGVSLETAVQRVLINELGLGGIYCVTKCGSSISAGKAETTIECVFQAYGVGDLVNGKGIAATAVPGEGIVNAGTDTAAAISFAQQLGNDWDTGARIISEEVSLAYEQTAADIKRIKDAGTSALGETWETAKSVAVSAKNRLARLFSSGE